MQIENPYQQYMYSYPHKTAYASLKNVQLKEYVPYLCRAENSLYFHIPFCQYRCGYCNLFSVAGQTEQVMQEYVDAMERHAKQFSEKMPDQVSFQDLTLGGGTPLILPVSLLRRVFFMAKNYFSLKENASVVIETSPNQTTLEKLAILEDEGVSRISIGVQSFQEKELAALCRFHDVESAKRALHAIKEKAFDCLNIDLIYGIPGQTTDSLLDSLRQAVAFEPEELFVYPLYVKPETALYKKNVIPSSDAYTMYCHVREFLKAEGYQPHSMRRFVKASDASLPESSCGFGNTVSIGCGGRSYIGNLHFCMPYAVKQEHCRSILDTYLQTKDYLQISHGFLLSPDEQKRRYVIRHILFGKGINCKDYRNHFSKRVQEDFPVIEEWEQNGYVTITNDFITLTEQGVSLSDCLGPQLISFDVRRKMEGFKK